MLGSVAEITYSNSYAITSYSYINAIINRPVAREDSVGSEEPPSQRKVHYSVMKGPLFKK